MTKQLARFIWAAFTAMGLTGPAAANDALVVYIECTTAQDEKTQGSGVLVSEKGHVLTARHVVPDGATCYATIGNNSMPKRGLRPSFQSHKIDEKFDALLMEFGRNTNETFPFAQVCGVSDALSERPIIAKGFHPGSFGAPSATDGILQNTYIRPDGIVETTAMTVRGKSGGPVFLRGTDNIVGIIAGAQFNSDGVVESYSILASDTVLGTLDMLTRSQSCAQQVETESSRESDAGTSGFGGFTVREQTNTALESAPDTTGNGGFIIPEDTEFPPISDFEPDAPPEALINLGELGMPLAVINDPDGYTNVRSEPGTHSEIIGRVVDGELFAVFERDGNWVEVLTGNGVFGFMHQSRVIIVHGGVW